MNNNEALQVLIKDKEDNKQYFEDIKTAKLINGNIVKNVTKYRDCLQKVLSMVNVSKMIDLKIESPNGYGKNYNVVLTNSGLKSRYIANNYSSQSNPIDPQGYIKIFSEAMKIIFNHPELSTLQKNKLLPLKDLDMNWLNDVVVEKLVKIDNVLSITPNMEVNKYTIDIQDFSISSKHTYEKLKEFTTLAIRTQIQEQLNEFLKERNETLELLNEKIKEIETMFPIVFLFGKS